MQGHWADGARCVAEEERRVRANAREYNEKFQYAVSGVAEPGPLGPRPEAWAGLGGWGLRHSPPLHPLPRAAGGALQLKIDVCP